MKPLIRFSAITGGVIIGAWLSYAGWSVWSVYASFHSALGGPPVHSGPVRVETLNAVQESAVLTSSRNIDVATESADNSSIDVSETAMRPNGAQSCRRVRNRLLMPRPDPPDNVPYGFSYTESPDAVLEERALNGDWYAQYQYAERLRASVLYGNDYTEKTWAQRFKYMHNFYVLALKNREYWVPDRLAEAFLSSTPNQDVVAAAAWFYIDELLGGEGSRPYEDQGVLELSDKQREAGKFLAEEFIELYEVNFLSGVDDDNVRNAEANEGSVRIEYDDRSDKLPPGGASDCVSLEADVSTSAGKSQRARALASALVQAQKQDEHNSTIADSVLKNGSDDFQAVRRELISSLRQGHVDALPVLVRLHREVAEHDDALEAAVWEEVEHRIFGADNGLGEEDPEYAENEISPAKLAWQYINMYGLD